MRTEGFSFKILPSVFNWIVSFIVNDTGTCYITCSWLLSMSPTEEIPLYYAHKYHFHLCLSGAMSVLNLLLYVPSSAGLANSNKEVDSVKDSKKLSLVPTMNHYIPYNRALQSNSKLMNGRKLCLLIIFP